MFLDFIAALFRAFFYTAAGLVFLCCIPFFILHVQETWDAPIYPHSGFSPECPTWEAPEDCPEWAEYANTLPPTEEDLATR